MTEFVFLGQQIVCHKEMLFHLWWIRFLNSSLEKKAISCGSLTPLRLPLRLMSCRTALSNPSFKLALSNISLSYEFRVIRRYTFTALLWPIRWQRAWACAIQSMFITNVIIVFFFILGMEISKRRECQLYCTLKMLRVHLQVILRVPVWVEYDTGVGGGEVDAQTSCSCTEEEHEAVRVHFTEAIDGSLPEIASNSPINTFIRIPTRIIQI